MRGLSCFVRRTTDHAKDGCDGKRVCPKPHRGSLQRSPRPLSWILGGLLLREEKEGSEVDGKRGGKEREGQGETRKGWRGKK